MVTAGRQRHGRTRLPCVQWDWRAQWRTSIEKYDLTTGRDGTQRRRDHLGSQGYWLSGKSGGRCCKEYVRVTGGNRDGGAYAFAGIVTLSVSCIAGRHFVRARR